MRRRRGRRATWFPVIGVGTTPGEQITLDSVEYTVDVLGTANVDARVVIPDGSAYLDTDVTQDHTLRDYVEGQTCIIERIVGKIVWQAFQFSPPNEDTTAGAIACCTAFAVLPAGRDGTPDIPSNEYDPFLTNNSAQPWLWRRTWVLGNNLAETDVGVGFYTNPASNEFFASVADGPHIDTKGTKRAIRREQRLYQINSVRGMTDVSSMDGAARCTTDLRVIGRMVKSTNRSTFQ